MIVVDRLLTGFDAPCLSTLFMDRPPMNPQNIIQAFSRTNRIFDDKKQYGQVVTFQYPKEYKEAINEALRLYSRGGSGNPIAEDWDDYDLVAHSRLKIDYEYIMELLQGCMEWMEQAENEFDGEEFEARIRSLKEVIAEFAGDNPKLSALLMQVVGELEKDRERFLGQDISVIINDMRYAVIDAEIRKFAERWYLKFEDVRYEAFQGWETCE